MMKRRFTAVFLVLALLLFDTLSVFAGQTEAGAVFSVQEAAEVRSGFFEEGEEVSTPSEAEESGEPQPAAAPRPVDPEEDRYTVTLITEHGSLSKSEVPNLPAGTAISASENQLTIGNIPVTATPDTGYQFSKWSGIPASGKVTENITISAVMEKKPAGREGCYLTFSSSESFTLSVGDNKKHWDGTLYYAVTAPEEEVSWKEWTDPEAAEAAGKLTAEKDGDEYRLYLRGTGNTVINGDTGSFPSQYGWKLSGEKIACYGNIETLLDWEAVSRGESPEMGKYCFCGMFSGCKSLTAAPSLPAKKLANYCYDYMFYSCRGLTSAPDLPATELADACYFSMFDGCTGLTSAPSLPATKLADYCYRAMFYGCTGLTNAPDLPATELADYCYLSMFYGCTGLTNAPSLPAEELANSCYYSMFSGCTGLTSAPSLPATKLANSCYLSMFSGCTGLTSAPSLPATELADNCYRRMFENCSSIALYENEEDAGTGAKTWKIPSEGSISNPPADWNTDMFKGTGGTLSTPKANQTYYLKGEKTGFTVSIQAGAGGTVSKTAVSAVSGTVISASGSQLTVGTEVITATPDAGYRFSKWEGIPASGRVTGNITIKAVMEKKPAGGEGLYLTFSSSESFTLSVGDNKKHWNGTLYYAVTAPEEEVSWKEWTDPEAALTAGKDGDEYRLYLRGKGNTVINGYTGAYLNQYGWVLSGEKIACDGNIETLLDWEAVSEGKSPKMGEYCFYGMFSGCTSLTAAPSLPATELASNCYEGMFYRCTGLTSAPSLPATKLADYCYYSMFYGCTGLTSAPSLPATKLADSCYENMFYGCTGLTSAPDLPVTELAVWCYCSMFSRCTGLTSAPDLPATELADYCYYSMFSGCTGLTSAPDLPATELADSCYSSMFQNCTGLTSAPSLPATELADYCYAQMFLGCTGLTAAPSLPAKKLADYCYTNMFYGCTGLTSAPSLPATELAVSCYNQMFYGCTGLTAVPSLPAKKLADACYCGMFGDCTSIALYETAAEGRVPWKIPAEGTITAADWNTSMFPDGDGKVSEPEANKEYYLGVNTFTVYIESLWTAAGTVSRSEVQAAAGTEIRTSGNQLIIGSETVTAAPVPGSDYSFSGWLDLPENGKVTEDLWIWAEFVYSGNPGYTVTVKAVNGSCSKAEITEVASGTMISASGSQLTVGSEVITATPNAGYHFVSWSGIPESGRVLEALTITAKFEMNRYTVTVSLASGKGSLDKTSVSDVAYGTAISSSGNKLTVGSEVITATPASGYRFSKWTGVPSGGKVTGDLTVTAVMAKKETGSGGGGGGGGSSSGGGGGIASVSVNTSAAGTFSRFWYADAAGVWYIKNKGVMVTGAWLCDDAVSANGQNVWYLLNTDGTMCSAGLVQDSTGNFYSLETTHNGYFGMLRYKNGTYDCNGQQVYLEFSNTHDGTFGAVKNAEGLEKLKAIYGVTTFPIGNDRCLYTSTFTD